MADDQQDTEDSPVGTFPNLETPASNQAQNKQTNQPFEAP